MDFRELNYVVAIAKYQSITKAAKALYISQPTLTKFVQNLENELGQPLFKRLGNKFLLSYAGERYIEKAASILSMKKQLDQELSDIIKENAGELKIAFPIMRGTYMLPYTLPIFKKKYPQVKINVYEANSVILEDMVLNGDTDLAFFNLPIKSANIDYEIINHEEIVLVVSKEHPLANQGVPRAGCKYPWIDIGRFKHDSFILQKPDQRMHQIADKIFKDADITPNISLNIRNILACVQLAAGGYGVCFVSENHLKHIDMNVPPVCFSIGNPCTTVDFVAAFRKGIYLSTYTKDFIRIVKECT